MKSRLLIFFFAVLSVYAMFNTGRYDRVLLWDKAGYYIYLPAAFVEHDLKRLDFYPKVDSAYYPTGEVKWYAIYTDSATNNRFTKYPVGVAVMELPFFLTAHFIVSLARLDTLYGFSLPYQLSVSLAEVVWLLIGLLFLRRLLLRYYSENIVFTGLFLILFGTNLYYYHLFDKAMSHVFSFALFSLLLYLTDSWYRFSQKRHFIFLCIVVGLITITRPTNAIIAIIPLLWGVGNFKDVKQRLSFFKKRIALIAFGLFCFFLILMIQLLYWKYTTDQWFVYSYTGETFSFLNPHIYEGLLSFRKGWFIYTPLSVFCIAGFIFLFNKHRQLFWSILLFTLVNIYLVFSWDNWYYGGGFSARALIESFAVLIIPLCALLDWAIKKNVRKWTLALAFTAIVSLNIFQSYQFLLDMIHPSEMNREYYMRVFGKLSVTEDDKLLLNK